MPERDGYDLIAAIRSMHDTDLSGIPAVAVTALARSEDRTRALKAGYNVHLAKPIEPRELLTAVARLIHANEKAEQHINRGSTVPQG